jgi:hypothetical protein
VRLAWEAYAGAGLWVPLAVRDETRALTLNGRVLLHGTSLAVQERLGRVEQACYYVRGRIVSGRHDAAPQVLALVANGVEAEQSVPPRAATLGYPAGAAPAGAAPLRFERLPDGDGWPGQRRALSEPSAVALRAFTLEPATERSWADRPATKGVPVKQGGADWLWREWQARADFDASGRADAHFVPDLQAGTLTFGDGEHGRALPRAAQLYVSYLTTRAAAGNVTGGTITQAPADLAKALTVSQPRDAWGGADAEGLDDVTARLLDGLARPTRAVTASDCEELAKVVPATAARSG